jgi:hypothetical protein
MKSVINSSTPSDLTISDKSTVTELANIISLSEITKPVPKKFTLNYGISSLPTINTGVIQLSNSIPIWQPDSETIALSNVELAQPLNIGDTSMYLSSIDTFLNGLYDYSGYFIVEREIIYFNGIEHNISYKKEGDAAWYPYNDIGKITIYSQDNLKYYQDLIISEALQTYGYSVTQVSITPNNVLKNLRRGMFGTKEVDHDISLPIDSNSIMCNLNATEFDLLGVDLSINGSTRNTIIYDKYSKGSIFIPSNKALHIPVGLKDSGFNYVKTIQKLYNPNSDSRIFTGIRIGRMGSGTEFTVAAGIGGTGGGKLNSILIKPTNAPAQEYFLNENDFGTSFINTASTFSEAIKFEIFIKNNNSVKVFINDTLITSSLVFSNIADSPYKNVKFDSDDYLILPSNLIKRYGLSVFTWQKNTSNVTGTNLYEISVGPNTNKTSYLGVTENNNIEEVNLINSVLDGLDPNGLDTTNVSLYDYTKSFLWTGTKNARQLKIFDVDIDQIPIRPAYNKIFLGNFSYNISALKNNYI